MTVEHTPDRGGDRAIGETAARPIGVGLPAAPASAVDLYWVPLGAGSPVVQTCGRLFEAASAVHHRRPRSDLYHAALQVSTPHGRYSIEQAPVPDGNGDARGVVAVGPVGIRAAARFRVFRYEVRCWRDGIIPDLADAVDSPVRLTTDVAVASRVVEVLPDVPTPVWGRDEAGVGEMWNSNSVVAWVLTRSGIDLDRVGPPPNGRAPGWNAGRCRATEPGSVPPLRRLDRPGARGGDPPRDHDVNVVSEPSNLRPAVRRNRP